MTINLFFVHGFLGLPSDWDPTVAEIKQLAEIQGLKDDLNFHLIDYMKDPRLDPNNDFETWGTNLNSQVMENGVRNKNSEDKNILIGYSLGGRLSLHAFFADPKIWNQLVCISTHPGLDTLSQNTEREERAFSDKKWSERFLNDSFGELINDWNKQSVLKSIPINRNENNYNRQALSGALIEWSLARQKDFSGLLFQLNANDKSKLIWIVGNEDLKFVHIAEQLKSKSSDLDLSYIPNSGHRVLFENPKALARLIFRIIFKKQACHF